MYDLWKLDDEIRRLKAAATKPQIAWSSGNCLVQWELEFKSHTMWCRPAYKMVHPFGREKPQRKGVFLSKICKFQWFAYGLPMVLPMGCPWFAHGLPMNFHGLPMNCHGVLKNCLGVLKNCPWCAQETVMDCLSIAMVCSRNPMVCPWFSKNPLPSTADIAWGLDHHDNLHAATMTSPWHPHRIPMTSPMHPRGKNRSRIGQGFFGKKMNKKKHEI